MDAVGIPALFLKAEFPLFIFYRYLLRYLDHWQSRATGA